MKYSIQLSKDVSNSKLSQFTIDKEYYIEKIRYHPWKFSSIGIRNDTGRLKWYHPITIFDNFYLGKAYKLINHEVQIYKARKLFYDKFWNHFIYRSLELRFRKQIVETMVEFKMNKS